jgi:hypothetical protein
MKLVARADKEPAHDAVPGVLDTTKSSSETSETPDFGAVTSEEACRGSTAVDTEMQSM